MYSVLRLALTMEEKLGENRRKGDREGWLAQDLDALEGGLSEEVGELLMAVFNGESPEAVWREAADVANTAMMIADKYEHAQYEAGRRQRSLSGRRDGGSKAGRWWSDSRR